MMLLVTLPLTILYIAISFGFIVTEGKRSPLGIVGTTIACFLFTTFGAYIIVQFLPRTEPIFCTSCDSEIGNSKYCGNCGKAFILEKEIAS